MEISTLTGYLREIVSALNELSGLALAGGLGWIIYILVSKNGPFYQLSNNHLSGLPRMEKKLDKIHITLKQGFTDLKSAEETRATALVNAAKLIRHK